MFNIFRSGIAFTDYRPIQPINKFQPASGKTPLYRPAEQMSFFLKIPEQPDKVIRMSIANTTLKIRKWLFGS